MTEKQQADETFREQVMATVAEVVNAYWALHLRIRNLEVQRDALDLAREFLSINRTRVEVGTMAPLEVSQAEAQAEVAGVLGGVGWAVVRQPLHRGGRLGGAWAEAGLERLDHQVLDGE